MSNKEEAELTKEIEWTCPKCGKVHTMKRIQSENKPKKERS